MRWVLSWEVTTRYMMLGMSEEKAGRQFLMRLDGMGSRTQVEFFIPAISFDRSVGDTGEN